MRFSSFVCLSITAAAALAYSVPNRRFGRRELVVRNWNGDNKALFGRENVYNDLYIRALDAELNDLFARGDQIRTLPNTHPPLFARE